MDKHYILRSKTRIIIAPGSRSLLIGETPGCDLTIDNDTDYIDSIIARIEPDRSGDGWHIVRMSRRHPISVNGTPVNRIVYLRSGDLIDINGERYKMEERDGENQYPSVTHIRSGGKVLWGLVGIVAILCVIIGWRIYDSQKERISGSMISEIESSLYSVRVDSLHLVCGDSIADTYHYASAPVGTAFLTTDSLLVTARHCLEPWLNRVLPYELASLPEIREWPIEKALFAETQNQLDGSEKWRLVSYITVTGEDGAARVLSSDLFTIPREDDEIVELGSYNDPKYWRSISHRYNRLDMMLGDVAFAKLDKGGRIPIADESRLYEILGERGVKLTFFGHPESGVTGNRMEYKTDELRLPLDTLPGTEHRIFLLVHGGALTPGYSGGPAIARTPTGFTAVGIVSVIDEKNETRSYSVPTSEIFRNIQSNIHK